MLLLLIVLYSFNLQPTQQYCAITLMAPLWSCSHLFTVGITDTNAISHFNYIASTTFPLITPRKISETLIYLKRCITISFYTRGFSALVVWHFLTRIQFQYSSHYSLTCTLVWKKYIASNDTIKYFPFPHSSLWDNTGGQPENWTVLNDDVFLICFITQHE